MWLAVMRQSRETWGSEWLLGVCAAGFYPCVDLMGVAMVLVSLMVGYIILLVRSYAECGDWVVFSCLLVCRA